MELGDGPHPYTYAEVAVLCHIEHSRRENSEPCGRDESARRAASLAATLNNRTLIAESLDAIEELVAGSLGSTSDEFGIVIRGLQALIDHTHAKKRCRDAMPDDRDARVRALIERLRQRYRHPDEQQEMLELAMKTTETTSRHPRLRQDSDLTERT